MITEFNNVSVGSKFKYYGIEYIKVDEVTAVNTNNLIRFNNVNVDLGLMFSDIKLGEKFKYNNIEYMKIKDGALRLKDYCVCNFGEYVGVEPLTIN